MAGHLNSDNVCSCGKLGTGSPLTCHKLYGICSALVQSCAAPCPCNAGESTEPDMSSMAAPQQVQAKRQARTLVHLPATCCFEPHGAHVVGFLSRETMQQFQDTEVAIIMTAADPHYYLFCGWKTSSHSLRLDSGSTWALHFTPGGRPISAKGLRLPFSVQPTMHNYSSASVNRYAQ